MIRIGAIMPNRVKPTGAMLAVSLLVLLTSQTLHAQETAPATTTIQQPAPVAQETVPTTQQAAPVATEAQPTTGEEAAPVDDEDASSEALPADGDTASAANPVLPHDLSPLGMFLAADIVVKGVMGALALASVATWAILIAKTFE